MIYLLLFLLLPIAPLLFIEVGRTVFNILRSIFNDG
jgi:hypothetical protein